MILFNRYNSKIFPVRGFGIKLYAASWYMEGRLETAEDVVDRLWYGC